LVSALGVNVQVVCLLKPFAVEEFI
jgi:hypothetical protein